LLGRGIQKQKGVSSGAFLAFLGPKTLMERGRAKRKIEKDMEQGIRSSITNDFKKPGRPVERSLLSE
jgi:hypothetical protein